MTRKSRRAKIRRRRRNRRPNQMDRMNQALGEFLTELGRVEFAMLMAVSLVGEPDIETLFLEYSKQTLKQKVAWFRQNCDYYKDNFGPENWARVQQIYEDLDTLLPKRNSLVHGETYLEELKGKPRQPYRVGVERDNIDYLAEFSRGEPKGSVFDTDQVREVKRLCTKTLDQLNIIRGVKNSQWHKDH